MRGFKLRGQRIQLSENDVEKQCADLLGLRGWYVLRQQSGLFRTPDGRWVRVGAKGLPDYAVMRAPSFLMEVKRPGGELSEEQLRKIREIEMCYRLPVVVVSSVDELAHYLDGMGVAKPP